MSVKTFFQHFGQDLLAGLNVASAVMPEVAIVSKLTAPLFPASISSKIQTISTVLPNKLSDIDDIVAHVEQLNTLQGNNMSDGDKLTMMVNMAKASYADVMDFSGHTVVDQASLDTAAGQLQQGLTLLISSRMNALKAVQPKTS